MCFPPLFTLLYMFHMLFVIFFFLLYLFYFLQLFLSNITENLTLYCCYCILELGGVRPIIYLCCTVYLHGYNRLK